MPAAQSAPRVEKKPQERTFHGDTYTDNYEWLRTADDETIRTLLERENTWTGERTAHMTPLIDTLVAEIAAHTQETDISLPMKDGDWWYYRRTWQGKQYPATYRIPDTGTRPSLDSLTSDNGEQCVWDGNTLGAGYDFFAATSFRPSPSGMLGALCCDYSGDEHYRLRIFDIATGAILDDSVSDSASGIAWTADSTAILYTRVDEAWRSYQVWLHHIGTDTPDRLLYHETDERYEITLWASRCGRYAVIHSGSPTTSEVRLVDLANYDAEPLLVAERRHGLDYTVEPAGDQLLIVHNAHSHDFELASAPIATSTPEEWTPLMRAEAGERISWVEPFEDFAVIGMRSHGAPHLRVIQRTSSTRGTSQWGAPQPISTQAGVGIEMPRQHDWNAPECILTIEAPHLPPTQLAYTPSTRALAVVKQPAIAGLDTDKYRATTVSVTAEDGTHVPMTIFHRADIEPDGTHPGLIYGYGAYEVSNDPYYKPIFLSLLDRGIVIGWTHIRGGGDCGRAWYEAGKELAKRNTFTDFVACARFLRTSGWVAQGRLAAEGRSAGGLLMGAVANIAPEEFCAIHAGVPFVDALTTILKPELPLTAGEWEEWGDPIESPEVYAYMKSYSPVENVREVEYPAILATTSLHDIRVSWLEPMKWIQVLRDRATNDPVWRPIMMRAELSGGHGGASGRYDKWRQEAFQYGWLIDQLNADWYLAKA